MSDKARLNAFYAVKRITEGAYSNLALPKDLTGLDRAFADKIIIGTLERKLTLEFVISKLVEREPQNDVKSLLMTGIYQILYMDRVPDNAVCDETVKIGKKLFGNKASGFINAVLRNVCRSKSSILEAIDNGDASVKYSVEPELYGLIKRQYPEDVERIFQSFFNIEPVFLRVNTLKSNAKTVAEKTNGNIVSETCVMTNEVSDAVKQLETGEFYIQGRASQTAVELLDAKPGDTVVDVCACPGGKTLGAAIDMNNKGKIFAFDLHKNKLPLIEKSADRLGISIISTDVRDAKNTYSEYFGIADRVICDVPCSGTGVMGGKPEIKYKSPLSFEGLYTAQGLIITSASKYLKIGGIMVYSTCSINKKENSEIVSRFLLDNPNYTLMYERTFLPFENEREGFYVAKIKREK